MKMPAPHIFAKKERGVALILTLGIITLVTLLLIAFAVSMRVENTASKNFNDLIKARELAQGAVDEAVALLKFNTTNSPANYYVTQPGRAASTWAPTYAYTLLRSIDFGSVPTNINLNADGSIIPLNSDYTTTNVATVQVDWVPVIYTNPATLQPSIIGRYAYWVDDEASKVNINSANQRVAHSSPYALPSDIDLNALISIGGTTIPANTRLYAQNYGFLTPAQWSVVSDPSMTSTIYNTNSFYVTAYSVDTNLTPWGDAKLDLNTLGTGTNGVAAVTNVLGNIGLTNWFPSSAFVSSTFANKYGATLLNQIAANILDYGTPGDDATTDSQTSPTYCGLKAVPYINEVITSAAIDVVHSNAFFGLSFELINPYSVAKGSGYTLTGTWTVVAGSLAPSLLLPANSPFSIPITANVPATNYWTTPTYWLYQTVNDPGVGSYAGASVPVTVTFSGLLLKNSASNLVDFAYDLTNPSGAPTNIVANGATNVFAIGDSDPRAHRFMTMVNPLTGATINLWGGEVPDGTHSFYTGHKPSAAPATDLTDDGTEVGETQVSYSNYHITESPYQSVAELGYIHIGIPWRSLRLQPRDAGTHIPDWVALDLFTTTNAPVPGRININAEMIQGGAAGTLNPRTRPLTALIGPAPSPLAGSGADSTIYNRTWVGTYAPPVVAPWTPTFTNVYAMAGQICEIQLVADTGATDALREDRVRSVIDMIALRSNTFTVWAVAQALKATPTGVIITGEAKIQAVVERYEDNSSGTPQVKFRTLYYRYL